MAQRDSQGPSRDEVQQRIHSLYDRAESATGNFNATRAMSTGNRRRVDPVLGGQRRGSDPALDDVARQWFDAARAKLGPTVPAVLPADRMPEDSSGGRPMIPAARRSGDDLPGLPALERAPADRPVRELTAGPTSGTWPMAELTARPMAALPAAPEPRQASPLALPGAVAASGQSTPATSKEQIQRKLATAREMLARHAAQQGTRPGTLESRPAGDAWGTPEVRGAGAEGWQQQAALTGMGMPGMSSGAGFPFAPAPSVDGAGSFAAPDVAGQIGAETLAAPSAPAVPAAPSPPPALVAPSAPFASSAPFTSAPSPDAPVAFAASAAPAVLAPAAGSAPFATDTFVGAGSMPEAGHGTKAAKAVAFARAQTGKPCVWGATGPDSYDAPGLTQAAWKAAGVVLPRTAQEQAAMGTPVSLTALLPGDLVFFHGTVGHVGICTGNGMMVHAPSPGAYIREESIREAGQSAIGAVRPA